MLGLFTLSAPEPSGQNKDKSPCSVSWHWKITQASELTWLYDNTHKYAVKQINIKQISAIQANSFPAKMIPFLY